jgi:hypothetical protein
MTNIEITLKLPKALVQDAQEFGLLEEDVVIDLLQQTVDRRVMEMVNQEIHDYQQEKMGRKP